MLGASGTVAAPVRPESGLPHERIGSGGASLPAVDQGSWIGFNVGDDPQARASRAEVMRNFFEAGGRLIDSSPMCGSSQPVIGAGQLRFAGITTSHGRRHPSRTCVLLSVLPAARCAVTGATAWAPGAPHWWTMPTAALRVCTVGGWHALRRAAVPGAS